jgi:ABC-type multidrug transport system ATPase subunit
MADNIEPVVQIEDGPKVGSKIDFVGVNMSLKLGKNRTKTILNNISGTVHPGKLTALMGPSGSGKTSLLNTLAGRTKQAKGLKLTGTICVNGEPVTSWSSYRRLCAYVEQDDLLFHTLTVTETLMLAAQLRLPRKMTYQEKVERVQQVMGELGLRKCANTRIGNSKFRGVSGGERKRVSIGLEILRGPLVLFLDECTSGLDSFQALRVVDTLKDLARNGRTVVTSIHQPRSSIYSLFDDMILLSEGQLMYAGSAQDLVTYYHRLGFDMPKNFNPADFALDLVSVDVRNEALEAESRARQQRIAEQATLNFPVPKIAAPIATGAGSSSFRNLLVEKYESESKYAFEAPIYLQFLLLTQRAVRQKLRDPTLIFIPIFIAVFFGLILGFVYFQNAQNFSQKAIQDKAGMLFFISLNQSFNGIIAVVSTFPVEKSIVLRERSARSYSVFPYFFSKILADLPMLICPFLFFTLAYWLAGFAAVAKTYFASLFICLLLYMTANGIGLVASAFMNSPEGAQAITMPFMCKSEGSVLRI